VTRDLLTPVMPVMPATWPGHSVLVVAVPALEELVRERTRHYDAAYVAADRDFAHAHVTLLGPFVDAADLTERVRADVAGVVGRHRRFTASFGRVAQFADGMIHLLPDDDRPFRRLTADLAAAPRTTRLTEAATPTRARTSPWTVPAPGSTSRPSAGGRRP
jgi:2'-5' RNA ligase superfamily